MTTRLARRSLGLLITFVFILLTVPPVMAAPVAVAAPLAVTVFSESMYDGSGSVSGTQTIAFFETGNYFQNDALTMSGTGDMRTTNASSGYAGASGSYNVFLTNTVGRYFEIADINTLAYTNLVLSFGVYKSTTAENGSSLTVAVSSDGANWTPLAVSSLPTGTGTAIWYYRTASGVIPATANLRIRFTNTSSAPQFRIDDVLLVGDSTGDPPPAVSGTVPTTGATGVSPNATITLYFSEPVDVATGAFTVECPVGTPVTFSSSPVLPASDTMSVVLTPSSALPPSTICTVTAVATKITDNGIPPNDLDGDGNGTPGGNYVLAFTTAAADPCTLPATLIHDIQGSGTSYALGGIQTIQGIVVGDYETGGRKGYFVQEEDSQADGNPATSEGIFVYDANTTSEVSLGDKVRVTGTVSEFSGLTELGSITSQLVCSSGLGALVAATPVSLPAASSTALEPYEGMKVTFAQALTVTDNYDLGYSGQLTLSESGKLWQFTHLNAPSVSGYATYLTTVALRSIILDDGRTDLNPDPIIYPNTGLTAANTVRVGDTVTGLTAVLDQYSVYQLQSIGQVDFTASNPRPTTAPAVGGNVKVGSFNTLNFFTTIGTTACGPSGGLDCRGADTSTEFTRQRDKLVAAICGLNADVLGLMELENLRAANDPDPDDGVADYVLLNLVGALNASAACPDDYAFIDNTGAGTDAIRQGLIYKPTVVTPVGATAILNSTAFINGGDSTARNRPALTQAFEVVDGGERFIITVNHLKSKGSPCNTPDILDGQGNCPIVRTNAANALTSWLAGNPTGTGDPDVLIVGDLNSYAKEDPIAAIVNAGSGYTDLINWTILDGTGYSYGFDGMAGYLDHALANSTLLAQTLAANEWHINSDEPAVLDYDMQYKSPGQQTSLYNADPYRSTDHDPVLVGLGLYPDRSDLVSSYGAAWHTGQGALQLGLQWTGEAFNTPGGDTGDDGVTIDTSDWRRGGTTAATAVVTRLSGSGNAWLAGWADWNNNGSFADPGELIVNGPVTVGSNTFSSIPIPVDAVVGVPINMRFRLYDSLTEPAALAPLAVSPSGRGNGGEVEDQSIRSIPLAVLLAGFDATAQGDAILVTWDTVSELNSQGFNLYRGGSPTAPETLLGYLPSQAPGSGAGASYQWQDEGLAAGQTFYYWLEAVDLSGATTLHGPVSATTQSPTAVTLSGLEADSRPGISAGWIGAALFLVIGLASVVLTAERRQRRVR